MFHPTAWLGRVGGLLLAPFTGMTSAVRHARMFHPDGLTFRARVEPVVGAAAHHAVASRLKGEALVRLSSAWWKGEREWIDALGLAVRFTEEGSSIYAPGPRDQDLLFATIRSPWTTLVAPLRTNVHDFLANDYYAVSPFFASPLGRVKWRLVSLGPHSEGYTRSQRLRAAVREGGAVFSLQERGLFWRRPWTTVATLSLIHEVQVDAQALRFEPFRTGRGIVPLGFIHALRRATYASSQLARSR